MRNEGRRGEAQRYFQRGLLLERAHRISEAVAEYRRAVDVDPTLREAHHALGFYYQRHGLIAKAAEEFRTVANLEGDFLSLFSLGYMLIELGRFEEALEVFERCLRLEPDDPATHYEIGFIHFSRGEFGRALAELEKPLRSYPEDWEIHYLIGNCCLKLGRYDQALAAFGHALTLASTIDIQAELLESMATVERHREFRQINTVKDQLYAQEGVVYLGSAQDDGLTVSEVEDYHFTYPDIGTTLQRFMALQQSYKWQFTALVAIDKLAEPLALVLAELMHVPLRRPSELQPDDLVLLVLAVAREVELLQLTLERAPCDAVAFCLGLNWLRHSKQLPELIGIAARGACSVPWEAELRRLRAGGAAGAQISACIDSAITQIRSAVQETPLDDNLPRQVRYYTRSHRRLSFPTMINSALQRL